jgi:hypothetical protein
MTEEQRAVLVVLPPALKRRLVTVAKLEAANINDLAVGTLAAVHSVPFEPSGRASRARPDATRVLLRMPLELKQAIQYVAVEDETNLTHEIVRTLAAAFGVRIGIKPPTRASPFGGGAGQPARRAERRMTSRSRRRPNRSR